jgi:hypothetical protein
VDLWAHAPASKANLRLHREDSIRSHLGKASPSRQDLTLSVSGQNYEKMHQASSAPRHRLGPHGSTARPPWTPVHVDRRLATTTALYPTPLIIYKGQGRPLEWIPIPQLCIHRTQRASPNRLLCSIHRTVEQSLGELWQFLHHLLPLR